MNIRQLHKQGVKIKHIAGSLGISRGTAYNNIQKEKLPRYEKINKRGSKLDFYKSYIQDRLKKVNLTAAKIFEEIKQMGYKGQYSWLAYTGGIRQEIKNHAVLRFETIPGEQSQWGYFGKIYDRELKRWIKLNCFLMILGYSRMLYIEFFEQAKLENF